MNEYKIERVVTVRETYFAYGETALDAMRAVDAGVYTPDRDVLAVVEESAPEMVWEAD